MSSSLTYKDYVHDESHMKEYAAYQSKYGSRMRESDRALIEIVSKIVRDDLKAGRSLQLIDIGCSTGNLLLHLKNLVPGLKLHGADLNSKIIDDCRANKALSGVDFHVMDMLNPPAGQQYDVVVTNAALMFFDEGEQFDQAIAGVGKLVKKGGYFVAFDYFSPYNQEVTIIETTKGHPKGLKFSFRSYETTKRALDKAGLSNAQFQPFYMPFDLPKPTDPSDVTSFTTQTTSGERLSLRGMINQPWCHLIARKV